jgi:quercetin dioxygenase-like cupin family protein
MVMMATKGQVLINPATGDSYEFLETAADTNGAYVTMIATVGSKGPLVPNHLHVLQEEHFDILSGRLTILFEGKTQVLAEGDTLTLPRNAPHNHYNSDDIPVRYKHTVTPAMDFEYLVETLVGLAADGRSKNGKYGLMQELVTLKYLDSKTYLADIPRGLQQMLMNILAPVGRMLGYRAVYKKYSGFEK